MNLASAGYRDHPNRRIYQFDLIVHLIRRNFVVRYKGSALGILWSVVPLLAKLAILVFVFGKVVPLGITAYPAFVFTGILPWTWFSMSVVSAGELFTGNRDLLRSPHFAPWVLIIVETALHLLPYLIMLPALIVTLIIYNREITWFIMIFPLLILIQGVLTIGLGLLTATMNVFYRDVNHIMSMAIMLLFYITPVFYQTHAVGDKYKILYTLNPVAALIQGYGAVFFYGRAPDWGSLLLAGITSTVVCYVGYRVYARRLPDIFDLI